MGNRIAKNSVTPPLILAIQFDQMTCGGQMRHETEAEANENGSRRELRDSKCRSRLT